VYKEVSLFWVATHCMTKCDASLTLTLFRVLFEGCYFTELIKHYHNTSMAV